MTMNYIPQILWKRTRCVLIMPSSERLRFHASNHLCLQGANKPLPMLLFSARDNRDMSFHHCFTLVGTDGGRVDPRDRGRECMGYAIARRSQAVGSPKEQPYPWKLSPIIPKSPCDNHRQVCHPFGDTLMNIVWPQNYGDDKYCVPQTTGKSAGAFIGLLAILVVGGAMPCGFQGGGERHGCIIIMKS